MYWKAHVRSCAILHFQNRRAFCAAHMIVQLASPWLPSLYRYMLFVIVEILNLPVTSAFFQLLLVKRKKGSHTKEDAWESRGYIVLLKVQHAFSCETRGKIVWLSAFTFTSSQGVSCPIVFFMYSSEKQLLHVLQPPYLVQTVICCCHRCWQYIVSSMP